MKIDITTLFARGADILPAPSSEMSVDEIVVSHALQLVKMRNKEGLKDSVLTSPYDAVSTNLRLPYLKNINGAYSFEHDNIIVLMYSNLSNRVPQIIGGPIQPNGGGKITGFIALGCMNADKVIDNEEPLHIFAIVNGMDVITHLTGATDKVNLATIIMNAPGILEHLDNVLAVNTPYTQPPVHWSTRSATQPVRTGFNQIGQPYHIGRPTAHTDQPMMPYPFNQSTAPEQVWGGFSNLGITSPASFSGGSGTHENATKEEVVQEQTQYYKLGQCRVRELVGYDGFRAKLTQASAIADTEPATDIILDVGIVELLMMTKGAMHVIEVHDSSLTVLVIRGGNSSRVIQIVNVGIASNNIYSSVSYTYNAAENERNGTSNVWKLDRTLSDYKIPNRRIFDLLFNSKY